MKPQPDFNAIARPYRWLEYLTLGRALERCRLYFLPQLLRQRRALVLGDGDGRFLAALMAANPHLHADAVDTSAMMLQLLSKRCEASASRLNALHANALTVTLTGPYDLVVTHFFLDCLAQPDLESLVNRIVPTLSSGALWVISDFHIPSGIMHLPARVFVRALYLSFRILTGLRTTQLPDYATSLTEAGLTRIAHRQSCAGILTTELWQVEGINQRGTAPLK